MPQDIAQQVTGLLQQAVASLAADVPPEAARWEIPKDPAFGDLASPVAFRLAASLRQPPPQVAQRLAQALQGQCRRSSANGWIERVEAAGGFVNVSLSQAAMAQILASVNRLRQRYGTSQAARGQTVLIEFVSANPTGPLSVAHGRQAAVGDALTRILRSQGARVTAEYYVNDEGRQIELLGRSLRARYLQQLGKSEPFPDDGYHGTYVTESAARLANASGEAAVNQPLEWFIERAMAEQLECIRQDLATFGLRFDQWTSQRQLRTSGRIDKALDTLHKRGLLYESEGALWFASTKFGDDKDRVVKKQSGELTYLAPDIAYHQEKFQRGYQQVINLWGPDHHGYIARIKAAVAALGYPADRLVVRLVQLVTLTRQGKPVPMSKRQGEFVTFREVLNEVGVDATRFFYLMRTTDSHLDFDLDLAKSQSQENPVYYVQYAHARIASILAYARTQIPWIKRFGGVNLMVLGEPEERRLLRQLFQFPMVVRGCAYLLEPHGVVVYLQKLAELFHVFYTKHRVVTADVPRSRARLALIQGVQRVLANGLGLLGVRAPTRM